MLVKENELPNMPDILKEICLLFKLRHKKTTYRMILNMTINKMAFAFCSKRIQFKEYDKLGYPNWYAMIFAPSGCGKDRIDSELEKYVFFAFKQWFDASAKKYEEKCIMLIENDAREKFGDLYSRKARLYIKEETNKLRKLVFQVYNWTAEGLFEEAKARKKWGLGAINIKITEFAKYFLNLKVEDKQFFSITLNAFDSKIPSKCIKNDNREEDIEDVPFNSLLMSDYSSFEAPRARQELLNELQIGLARRENVTFIPSIKFEIDTDAETIVKNNYLFFEQVEVIGKQFEIIFNNLNNKAIYEIPAEVLTELENYKLKSELLCNEYDKEILRKEILDRQYKAVKLAKIFAVLNQKDNIVTITDVTQAISVIEYLSADFKKFVNYRPNKSDSYDEL